MGHYRRTVFRSLWTWLWGRYHVLQNVFLVIEWTQTKPKQVLQTSNNSVDIFDILLSTAGLFIGCVLRWRHLVNAFEVKAMDSYISAINLGLHVMAHRIGCWQNFGAVCFWLPIPSGLNLMMLLLLSCVTVCVSSHCCPAWQTVVRCLTVRKVDRFNLINRH